MERWFWVCVAGAIGTGVRYAVALWAGQRMGVLFPYGTLIVNLVGCFLIAVLLQSATSLAWSPTLRAALTVGFVGGLTTYSSFNYETTRLVEAGRLGAAGLNALLTLVGGFAAGWTGLIVAKRLLG